MARIKADKGKLEASEKLCFQAIKLDKVSAEAYYLLSTILSEQGKTKEAISSLNNTIFLDPDFVLGHFLLGNISLKTGKKTEQKKHFRNALRSLDKLKPEKILYELDGFTAGRLTEIINSIG